MQFLLSGSLRIGARLAPAQRADNPLAFFDGVDAIDRRQLHRLLAPDGQ